jgi:hypothetical protein
MSNSATRVDVGGFAGFSVVRPIGEHDEVQVPHGLRRGGWHARHLVRIPSARVAPILCALHQKYPGFIKLQSAAQDVKTRTGHHPSI